MTYPFPQVGWSEILRLKNPGHYHLKYVGLKPLGPNSPYGFWGGKGQYANVRIPFVLAKNPVTNFQDHPIWNQEMYGSLGGISSPKFDGETKGVCWNKQTKYGDVCNIGENMVKIKAWTWKPEPHKMNMMIVLAHRDHPWKLKKGSMLTPFTHQKYKEVMANRS